MREPDRETPPQGRPDPKPEAISADLRSRLDALKADLGDAIAEGDQAAGKSRQQTQGGELGAGLRAATEFVAGILVGLAIGYLLDRQLGSKPLFMIIFLILGMGAGFRNLYRLGQKRTSGTANPPRQNDGA